MRGTRGQKVDGTIVGFYGASGDLAVLWDDLNVEFLHRMESAGREEQLSRRWARIDG